MQSMQEEKIDEYVSEIHAAKDMDLIRWKEIYGEPVDYEGEVQRIRDFLSARKPFLDKVWKERQEICTVSFVSEDGAIHNYMSVLKGERLERMPGAEPGTVSGDRVFDGWYTEEGIRIDETTPVSEDVTIYARSSEVTGTAD